MAFIGKPFDPKNETFEASFGTSRARFDYYARKRLENAHLQNTAPTYGWVKEAVGVTKVLLDKELDRHIETPLLLVRRRGTRSSVYRNRTDSFRSFRTRSSARLTRSTKSTCLSERHHARIRSDSH